MDNNIFEMFTKLMGNSQNNGNNNFYNYQNNPAYTSYPKEAYTFTQKENNSSNANFSNNINEAQQNSYQNDSINNNSFNNSNNILNSFASMFNNLGQNNQLMPLLMSLMGKSTNLSSLSEIFSSQKKTSSKDYGVSENENSQSKEETPNSEILL